MLEDVTRMVSALDLFSRNESIEEGSTQSVKFFLLPFLLGNLNAKLSNDLEQRLEVIRVVQTYYMDFLRRVKDYGIVSHQLPDVTEEEAEEDSSQQQRPGPPNLAKMNSEREEKLARYREKKSLDLQVKELRGVISSEDHRDDDLVR